MTTQHNYASSSTEKVFATVSLNKDWDEWQVKLWSITRSGRHVSRGCDSYFTPDKDDAIDTMRAMLLHNSYNPYPSKRDRQLIALRIELYRLGWTNGRVNQALDTVAVLEHGNKEMPCRYEFEAGKHYYVVTLDADGKLSSCVIV